MPVLQPLPVSSGTVRRLNGRTLLLLHYTLLLD